MPGCSLLKYAPALVLFVIVVADSAQYADTDLWGHVRFGQLIVGQRHLIRHAPFTYSFAPPGPAWVDHEWLAQVIMALCYDATGVTGLKLWKFACAAATIILLAFAEAETGASAGVQFVVLVAAAGALVPQMQFRPQLFDYVLLAAIIAMLARESYGGRRAPLWTTVPILMLWANLHGAFIIGVVVLAIYAVATGAADVWRGAGWRRTLRLAAVTVIATAATLVNPYGLGVWRVLLHTARTPLTMQRVVEYRPLLALLSSSWVAGSPIFPYVCFLAMLCVLVICVIIVPGAEGLGLVAAALFLSAGALYAVRNVALAVIAVSVPLARHAGLIAARLEERSPGTCVRMDAPAPMRPALQVLVAALALALAVRTGLFSSTLPAAAASTATCCAPTDGPCI
jgi:hypothetical protein